jgi:hypothetical protein
MLARKALAGTAGAPKEYVEDVFSTYLYTGSGATKTITNDIDLSGEGGMVWIKARSTAYIHCLYDTERGALNTLTSNTADASISESGSLTAFNADGFTLGSFSQVNHSSSPTYVAWTFRQAKKFFDVVTYTGDGTAPRDIAHNLGSSPGCVIIKRTSGTGNWWVWHRSIANKNIYLDATDAADSGANPMISGVSSTAFTLATNQNATMNASGATYVAYLFAHDAGGFGDAGSDNVISCGSFTTNGSGEATVTLNYEPQWLLLKPSSTTGNWLMVDTMRGWNVNATGNIQRGQLNPTSTGFKTSQSGALAASQTYIYIAIRRGPMKTPTTGTSVFTPDSISSSGVFTADAGFPVDLAWYENRAGGSTYSFDRLRGNPYLLTESTSAETSSTGAFDSNTNFRLTGASGDFSNWISWLFRRAPGFFDVVCYTGTGSARTISHNLGATPELMIVKSRSSSSYVWAVYNSSVGATKYLRLNSNVNAATESNIWNDTAPTSSVFTVGTGVTTNESGGTYVAYLFASVSGVSKVGSYTGNGSSVTVTTDFQPRFILVKRTDSNGNWIVSDSARGLVSGSDPYLLLNDTAAEDTDEDWVDITSTSFTVNQTTAANANVNTGTYIYLAIA